ncbi:MAG: DNA ligase [Proteobacteria bacterium]|nr:DNA ligase [Pseudomonadota bacterium]MCP4921508.1 DNA ligase [Pseudomonadota bacterium]
MAGTPHSDERTAQLVELLTSYNEAYRAGEPLVTDLVYDELTEELRALDPENGFLHAVEPESTFGLGKVRHAEPMLSTEKAYTEDALRTWVGRVEKAAIELGIPTAELRYRVTPKLDGLAGKDQGGVFATRGNGRVGNDITYAFQRGIVPIGGRDQGVGEIVMVKSWFEANLADVFDHPRNTCVGIVSADVVGEVAKRALDAGVVHFVPYGQLQKWVGSGAELLEGHRDITSDLKGQVDYALDGMVAEVLEPRLQTYMGATSHHHRWMIAIKERGETAETTVNELVWQTGRTGNVTPVMLVEPVKVSGATIRRVTAHHAGMIRDKQIGVGARIQIIRSGEVIPKLEEVLKVADEVVLPSHCPRCEAELGWRNDFLACPNTAACPAQVETGLRHWFRTLKTAEHFGPKTIERLVAGGFDSLEKLYALTEADLKGLEFGDGQTANLLAALVISRNLTVEDARWLAAFGIVDLGVGDSRKLLAAFPLETLDSVTVEQLKEVKGFGDITSASIVSGLAAKWSTIRHMLEVGFVFERTPLTGEEPEIDSPIAGKRVLFTGKMVEGTRDDMKIRAKALGAALASGISKSLDLLVIGEKASQSKIDKATKYEVEVLTEAEYLARIG